MKRFPGISYFYIAAMLEKWEQERWRNAYKQVNRHLAQVNIPGVVTPSALLAE